jgi:hypothetical protein
MAPLVSPAGAAVHGAAEAYGCGPRVGAGMDAAAVAALLLRRAAAAIVAVVVAEEAAAGQ